ncbi:MAG: DUF523 domain-containing protein [Candidatus Omnitrophota bacterium]
MRSRLKKEKILVSACLFGIGCRFDGKTKDYEIAPRLMDKAICFPVCAEILGGFGVPRRRIEIKDGDGKDVLEGKAKVLTQKGIDVTNEMVKAARVILEFCLNADIKKAVLKEKSPSCAKHFIHDGCFANKIIEGKGVLTALLEQYGIEVFSETEIDKLCP